MKKALSLLTLCLLGLAKPLLSVSSAARRYVKSEARSILVNWLPLNVMLKTFSSNCVSENPPPVKNPLLL